MVKHKCFSLVDMLHRLHCMVKTMSYQRINNKHGFLRRQQPLCCRPKKNNNNNNKVSSDMRSVFLIKKGRKGTTEVLIMGTK